MRVRDFEWKKSGESATGFIAQELANIYSPAVDGEDGAMEEYIVSPAIEAQEEIAWGDELPTDENTKDEIKAFMDSHSFEYNSGDTKHDLLDKIPELKQEAVEGIDAVMGERVLPMTVSRDVLVPVLVKAIQELSAKVEALENA
jgi:hypothetical protein